MANGSQPVIRTDMSAYSDGQPIEPVVEFRHADEVTTVSFLQDGSGLLTASMDGTARTWNAINGAPLIPALNHAGAVRAWLVDDDQFILTASRDHTARLWDRRTGQAVVPAVAHGGAIREALWLSAASLLLTAGDDRRVRTWGFPPAILTPAEARQIARA